MCYPDNKVNYALSLILCWLHCSFSREPTEEEKLKIWNSPLSIPCLHPPSLLLFQIHWNVKWNTINPHVIDLQMHLSLSDKAKYILCACDFKTTWLNISFHLVQTIEELYDFNRIRNL